MKLTKEERAAKLKAKEDAYYSLRNELDSINWTLRRISEGKKRTYAFKLLAIAINLTLEQIKNDYDRYVRRIRRMDASEDVALIQRSLNRANKKNAELEKKIQEAKTSSGLFIDFVRDKLNLK